MLKCSTSLRFSLFGYFISYDVPFFFNASFESVNGPWTFHKKKMPFWSFINNLFVSV
jgi:hypothetical protein